MRIFLAALLTMAGLVVQAQNQWSYGEHVYTMEGTLTAEQYSANATGTVTFTNVPKDFKEFETLYRQYLGKTPHGTAAMMPMAMEIYGRDREEGRKCIELICWSSNVSSVVSQLNNKFGQSQYAPENDSYHQRYLPAAVLKGATPENGYSPLYPYTVEMKASVNKHRDMQFMGTGRVVYLYILGKGWDTNQRSVEIIKPEGSELHQVFNCPALYTQCKTIRGTWKGLK